MIFFVIELDEERILKDKKYSTHGCIDQKGLKVFDSTERGFQLQNQSSILVSWKYAPNCEWR